jgi:hypothetical protein
MTDSNKNDPQESPPPFLGTWDRLYKVILVIHFVLLVFFYLFFNYFS